MGRAEDLDAIERVCSGRPSVLLLEGDAGIGKTTILQASADMAERLGIHVLSCAAWSSEMRLAYTALGDLLAALEDAELAGLPPPQRDALDAVLLRAEPAGGEVDSRAVGAATLAVVRELARAQRVLIVIDDVQWLDRPSARVIAYVARRLPPEAGLIASCRTGLADGWLGGATRSPTELRRLEPLRDRDIERLLRERAPAIERRSRRRIIHAAGGNPFYALELARASREGTFPTSLAALIDARLSALSPAVEELLLALAAVADPTLRLLTDAVGSDAQQRFEVAEERGVVVLEGARVRFAHPLLAEAIYSRARPGQRRAMHRRLSGVVAEPGGTRSSSRARRMRSRGDPGSGSGGPAGAIAGCARRRRRAARAGAGSRGRRGAARARRRVPPRRRRRPPGAVPARGGARRPARRRAAGAHAAAARRGPLQGRQLPRGATAARGGPRATAR